MHSGLFFDETATLSHWHIPAAHYLEAWSDARTIDGTVSIVQPLIQPLYGGKSAHEVIATMSERPERAGYDVVREYWQANKPAGASGAMGAGGAVVPVPARSCCVEALAHETHRAQPAPRTLAAPPAPADASRSSGASGCTTASSAARPRWRRRRADRGADVATRITAATPIDGIEINFRRDPTIYDGRYANNGWLQELPKPMRS